MDPVRFLRRRYHALLALRWLPTGMLVTVFVLLLRQRQLSLAEIGVGMAAQGIVMLVLELPSGGLADALGRKPVLVVGAVFGIAASVLLVAAHSVALLAVVGTLSGIFRALDSGPLQAWFVDAAVGADPDTNIERELAHAGVVTCAALGAGALVGSGIVRAGGLGIDPLLAPVVAAVLLQLAGLGALVALMDEHRVASGWRSAVRSAAAVPAVMHGAVRAIRASSLLVALVVAELLWGIGMVAFELFFPSRLADVTGGADSAAGTIGLVVAVAWLLSALGAASAPVLVGRFGPGRTGCGLRIANGAAVVAMGLAAGPAGLVVAYLTTYWAHGATNPVHYGMVHRAVAGSHRATVVSANSLTSQLGGAAGGIVLGVFADRAGIPMAMVAGGLVLAAAAPLYLVRSRGSAVASPALTVG